MNRLIEGCCSALSDNCVLSLIKFVVCRGRASLVPDKEASCKRMWASGVLCMVAVYTVILWNGGALVPLDPALIRPLTVYRQSVFIIGTPHLVLPGPSGVQIGQSASSMFVSVSVLFLELDVIRSTLTIYSAFLMNFHLSAWCLKGHLIVFSWMGHLFSLPLSVCVCERQFSAGILRDQTDL